MNGQMHEFHENFEQALPISRSVQQTFQCLKPMTIVRHPRIWMNFGIEQPFENLKRKRCLQTSVNADYKAFQGCIFKRMGRRINQRSKRQRILANLSCTIHSVI